MTKENEKSSVQKRRDANTCIGMGVGIGALGIGSALTIGATCPLCVIAAPALIGVGVAGRILAKKSESAEVEKESGEDVAEKGSQPAR